MPSQDQITALIAERYEEARLNKTVDRLAADCGLSLPQLYNAASKLSTEVLYPTGAGTLGAGPSQG